MIGVYSEERLRSVAPDQREEIANKLIWMFLGEKHRQALKATMDIYSNPKSGIFPLFRALDKMDPIVAVWRYLHHFRGKLGQNPSEFNKAMKDFFENPDIRKYMADNKIDKRLLEAVTLLQDRRKAWDYYLNADALSKYSQLTHLPQHALKKVIEGIPLYIE
jgi:hypothetical protein